MSPTMVKTGLAVLVPVLIHHLISQGHVDQQGQQMGRSLRVAVCSVLF